jgi:hypothetical protein
MFQRSPIKSIITRHNQVTKLVSQEKKKQRHVRCSRHAMQCERENQWLGEGCCAATNVTQHAGVVQCHKLQAPERRYRASFGPGPAVRHYVEVMFAPMVMEIQYPDSCCALSDGRRTKLQMVEQDDFAATDAEMLEASWTN